MIHYAKCKFKVGDIFFPKNPDHSTFTLLRIDFVGKNFIDFYAHATDCDGNYFVKIRSAWVDGQIAQGAFVHITNDN